MSLIRGLHRLGIVFFTLGILSNVVAEILDCSLYYEYYTDVKQCSNYNGTTGSYNYFYCYNGYTCCPDGNSQGCCYEGKFRFLYSPMEISGLVLSTTALATAGILALVIFGAAYCNAKDDASHLFMPKKK